MRCSLVAGKQIARMEQEQKQEQQACVGNDTPYPGASAPLKCYRLMLIADVMGGQSVHAARQ